MHIFPSLPGNSSGGDFAPGIIFTRFLQLYWLYCDSDQSDSHSGVFY